MIFELIKHSWRETTRSSFFQRRLISNIIIGLLIGYLFMNLLVLGIFVDVLLEEYYPYLKPITAFNSFILYYIAFDLFFRFVMQSIPVMSIEPYLHLPINKFKIINYLLIKSFRTFFNFLPLLILIPFTIKTVTDYYPTDTAWLWFLAIYLLLLGNCLTAFYLKKQVVAKPLIVVVFGILIGSSIILDKAGIISISDYSINFFYYLLNNPDIIFVFLAYPVIMYIANYSFLKSNIYIQEIGIIEKTNVSSGNITIFKRFGDIGELLALELKLILRNKRPRSVMISLLIILIYGVLFYPQDLYQEVPGFLIFVGVMMTGMPIIGYGNLLLSWNSSFFDAVLTNNVSTEKYLLSKFLILSLMASAMFLLTIPYVYFGIRIVVINLVSLIFNIGVITYLMIYAGMMKPKKIDLSKKAAFNYEGVSGLQFATFLPVIFIPQIIMIPFYITDTFYLGVFTLAVIGLTGIAMNKILIGKLAVHFNNKKHIVADNFRAQ